MGIRGAPPSQRRGPGQELRRLDVSGRPFKPGRSGNPRGRPKGARSKALLALEALFDNEAETISRRAIELALGGDGPALRLCMERILPARKDRPVLFDMPPIETAADLSKATGAILDAVARGHVTPSEAASLGQLVTAHIRALEATELAEGIANLEAAQGKDVNK
ncbi:DUF5681 domain-containing protein [Methylobacterium sp. J-090]|nr:DUF5681 domain-containing protein [Methylobacterium sp. J-090]